MMSNLKTTIVIAAFLVAANTATAQTSYLMTCRGGADMRAVAGQRVSDPHVFVEISFKPGTAGAGVQAPSPGECTWIDRGFRSGEPTKLLFDDNTVAWTQTICRVGDCWVNTPSSKAATLMNWVKGGQPFQVHVFNNNSGHLIVTKIGP